jgi:hypothetical protein
MTVAAQDRTGGGRLAATVLTFVALAALSAAELKVAALDVAGPGWATALGGLLLLKVGLVLLACLRAGFRRRSATRLTLLALVLAAGFAAVLMLEAAFQARLR